MLRWRRLLSRWDITPSLRLIRCLRNWLEKLQVNSGINERIISDFRSYNSRLRRVEQSYSKALAYVSYVVNAFFAFRRASDPIQLAFPESKTPTPSSALQILYQ